LTEAADVIPRPTGGRLSDASRPRSHAPAPIDMYRDTLEWAHSAGWRAPDDRRIGHYPLPTMWD
jgi:hypothetical protein